MTRSPLLTVVLVLTVVCTLAGQSTDIGAENGPASTNSSSTEKQTTEKTPPQVQSLPKSLLHDQRWIWTSPLRLKKEQIPSLLLFGTGLAALTQVDRDIQARTANSHSSLISHGSDAGIAIFAGTTAAFYAFGTINSDDHARETAVLTTEAVADSLVVSTALQRAFGRTRPGQNSAGDLLKGGTSFPSNHSSAAWAAASVFAHEYPGWGTKVLSYGLASAVSGGRVAGGRHYFSDTLVGGALGWFIGDQVYRRRHDPDLPGASWGTFSKSGEADKLPNPMHQGSSYVPLDSWVYEAFDRLSALGYAPRGFQGMRPWTRTECSRLLGGVDAEVVLADTQAAPLYRGLLQEFSSDAEILRGGRTFGVSIEDVYARLASISGAPLSDGFHFGQTLTNDYGRPYGRGANLVTGIATHVEAGPFAFYVRAEYQHAGAAPALTASTRAAVAAADGLPESPELAASATNRVRLLDSYIAMNVSGWQASFGRQSLWWGPGGGGDLMLSNNTEPITMLRLSRITPFVLPGVLKTLGQIRSETFIGQLDGYHFLRLGPNFVLTGSYEQFVDPQPFLWGQKISLQPTPNLEIGVSITTVFAGQGRPLTLRTFGHTLSSSGNAQVVEPGDRRTGFDFSYRVPHLRKWLVLYNGSMSEDEPNPIAYPRRSAMNPGIYLPQIPGFKAVDLHVEGGYTNLPNDPRGAVFYTNTHYVGGYTNNAQLMGSWLGPQSRGLQVWSNHWRSGVSRVQLGYRSQTVDPAYISGGTLQDFRGEYRFRVAPNVIANAGFQFERWRFPALSAAPRNNVTLSVQFNYRPGSEWRR